MSIEAMNSAPPARALIRAHRKTMNPFSKDYESQLETADLAKTAHQRVVQKATRKERMQSTDSLTRAQAKGAIMGLKPKETPQASKQSENSKRADRFKERNNVNE